MKWNEQELKKAIDLLKDGFNFIEIGKKLNRSRASVKNKLEEKGIRYKDFNPSKEIRNCKNCSKQFETTILNEKTFCNQSCSAIYNNKKRPKIKNTKFCLNCNKELNKQKKFCSCKCQAQNKRNLVFKKIENGTHMCVDNYSLRNYLIEKHGAKCMKCGWMEVNTVSGLVPIQLDHIDGNSDNNKLDNLRLLCPNCHSLTPTFGRLNKNGRNTIRNKKRKESRSKTETA